VVTARADYSKLDQPAARTRLRLDSTVVRVRHLGPRPGAGDVELAYVRQGRLEGVRARHCVLACWHVVVPHLFPELPDEQKLALSDMVKVPIVYTNVVLRRFAPFAKLGVGAIDAPGSYFSALNPDTPVSVGAYKAPAKADEPVVVHMLRTPCSPGLPARDQHRAGRLELFGTTFETFERNVRDQLARMLGAGGFDPAADILGLTVNRWPHGYAYQYNSLWDPFWRDGKTEEQPCLRARRPFGNVAIANADAGAYAYTDCAIDHAYRAVEEIGRLKG
jgi:spermidine dehydrogenase